LTFVVYYCCRGILPRCFHVCRADDLDISDLDIVVGELRRRGMVRMTPGTPKVVACSRIQSSIDARSAVRGRAM
jgi:hypothetical protein